MVRQDFSGDFRSALQRAFADTEFAPLLPDPTVTGRPVPGPTAPAPAPDRGGSRKGPGPHPHAAPDRGHASSPVNGRAARSAARRPSPACTTIAGEAVRRAGGRSRPFTYEQLYTMAVQHCLKHHSENG
ncbi:hypothetical protein GCM10010276_89720 [Streptomyces longisporus]|uniref:Uncharacterized protein n=1 Tax=Streptomyces longisporus TaxID=1948 RepID=A0ABN3NJV8_STRLO